MNAADVIALLELRPHPEGGWFTETWRAAAPPGERSAGTAIYYLLDQGDRAHWHRLDVDEVWHHYAGGGLVLEVARVDGSTRRLVLGPRLHEGERPQAVVPAGAWQSAEPVDGWVLVGCTMAPGFAGEDLAPPCWSPDGADPA